MVEITAVARNADVQVDSIIALQETSAVLQRCSKYQMKFSGTKVCFHLYDVRFNSTEQEQMANQ
jgi:hypothetical protein